MAEKDTSEKKESTSSVTTKPVINYYKTTWMEELSGNIFRKVLLPLLQNKILTYNELVNLCNEEYCKNNFGISVPLISYKIKAPFYVDKFRNRNHEYYAYKEWNKEQKEYLINWIVENNVKEVYEGNRWELLSSEKIITKIIAPLLSEDILDNKIFIELQNPISCKNLFYLENPIFPYINYSYLKFFRDPFPTVTIKKNYYYYNDKLDEKQKQLLIYYLSDKLGADNIQNYYETICCNYKPFKNPAEPIFKKHIFIDFHFKEPELFSIMVKELLQLIPCLLSNTNVSDELLNELLSPNPETPYFKLSKPLLEKLDDNKIKYGYYSYSWDTKYTTINGKKYIIKLSKYSNEEKEQLINWVLITNIGKTEVPKKTVPTPEIEKPKPIEPVIIPPRIRRIIDIYSSEKKDALDNYLKSMGKAWFVAYAYYIYRNCTYRRWELAGTLALRISCFKKSICSHMNWLKQIATDTTANYGNNQVDLNNKQIRELASAILELPENVRYENCNRLL